MDNYSIGFMLGVVVGLILVGAALMLFSYCHKKKYGTKKFEYDERQQLARGKAYKLGFWTLAGYVALLGFFDAGIGFKWCDTITGAFIGILLAITVFAISCIKNDAYMALKEKPRRTMWLLGGVGLMNLGIGLMNASAKPLLSNGMLNFRFINFACAAMAFIVDAAFIIKNSREEAAGEEQ